MARPGRGPAARAAAFGLFLCGLAACAAVGSADGGLGGPLRELLMEIYPDLPPKSVEGQKYTGNRG
jgi:hypothetical protein